LCNAGALLLARRSLETTPNLGSITHIANADGTVLVVVKKIKKYETVFNIHISNG